MAGLSFYMHDGPKTFRFELNGGLAGVEASRLAQAWRTASSTIDGKILCVDVTHLTFADEKGRDLLARWHQSGAHFAANSAASRALMESITGQPYAIPAPPAGPAFSLRSIAFSLRAAGSVLICTAALLFPVTASASDGSSTLLERYSDRLSKGAHDKLSVAVEIEASLPGLDKSACAAAIRRSRNGKSEYEFISAEGDPVVRNEIIARYFAIDTASLAVAITKSNCKFHFVRTKGTSYGFRISPRRKRPGTITGELWIDVESGLPTHLEGRLLKTPSVLLRRVDVPRRIRDGETYSRETRLHIDTRSNGRAELTIRERLCMESRRSLENISP